MEGLLALCSLVFILYMVLGSDVSFLRTETHVFVYM